MSQNQYTINLSSQLNPSDSLLWSNGSNLAQQNFSQSGTYQINVWNACGLYQEDFNLRFDQNAQLQSPNPAAFCAGDSSLLFVSGGTDSLLWSNNFRSDSLWVKQPGLYSVSAHNQCGSLSDTVFVMEEQPLNFNLGPDSILCNNASKTLSGPAQAHQYLWQDGSTQTLSSLIKSSDISSGTTSWVDFEKNTPSISRNTFLQGKTGFVVSS
jgi:hypothetical protein